MEDKLMDIMYDEIQAIDVEIKELQLILENETYRKIKFIAEGNSELERNLECQDTKKVLLFRIKHLEKEISKLKKRAEGLS